MIVLVNGISTSGTSGIIFQLGVSGTPETTGYTGTLTGLASASTTSEATAASGFNIVGTPASSNTFTGVLHLWLQNATDDTWLVHGKFFTGSGGSGTEIVGVKALAGALDTVRLTTENGSDTFDAGAISHTYE